MSKRSITANFVLAGLFIFASSVSSHAAAIKNGKVEKMDYRIQTETLEARSALVIKGKAKIADVGAAIGRILESVELYIEGEKAEPSGPPFTRTFSFENGVLEFESGFPVASKVKPKGEIIGTELPKGLVATTIHIGSQDNSQIAYEAIQAWIVKNKKKEAGAPWEVYLTDPASTPPEKSKMQIFFPIR